MVCGDEKQKIILKTVFKHVYLTYSVVFTY